MIGIITLPNFMFYNYGGVLQNYALYRYLNEAGYEIEAIHCNSNTIQGALRMLIYDTLHIRILKTNGKIKTEYAKKTVRERNKHFEHFISENMKVQKYWYYSPKVYQKINSKYDCIIVGSDQVWNPSLIANGNMMDTYLLTFLPKEKSISYAASFGISELPKSVRIKYTDALSDFAGISVREESGAAIIKDLINIDAEVLIDPTLLLTRDQWKQIAIKHPNRSEKKYLLKYYLGEQNKTIKKQVDDVAKKFNLDIYELANTNEPSFYETGPAEFVDLFQHASVIFTDSFHASVFSIIFGHPCIVSNRQQVGMDKMGSRIDTLFDKLGLNRLNANDLTEEMLVDYDFNEAYRKLESERNQARSYLERVLSKD